MLKTAQWSFSSHEMWQSVPCFGTIISERALIFGRFCSCHSNKVFVSSFIFVEIAWEIKYMEFPINNASSMTLDPVSIHVFFLLLGSKISQKNQLFRTRFVGTHLAHVLFCASNSNDLYINQRLNITLQGHSRSTEYFLLYRYMYTLTF